MNKWIEQESKECSEERGNIPHGQFDRECKEAFQLGAQAVLAKVKEIIEQSRKDNELEMYHVDTLKDPLRNEGRESLRQEILEALE